jgi:hypothetical protein
LVCLDQRKIWQSWSALLQIFAFINCIINFKAGTAIRIFNTYKGKLFDSSLYVCMLVDTSSIVKRSFLC